MTRGETGLSFFSFLEKLSSHKKNVKTRFRGIKKCIFALPFSIVFFKQLMYNGFLVGPKGRLYVLLFLNLNGVVVLFAQKRADMN